MSAILTWKVIFFIGMMNNVEKHTDRYAEHERDVTHVVKYVYFGFCLLDRLEI